MKNKKFFWFSSSSIVVTLVLIFIAILKIGPLFNFYIIPPSPQNYTKLALSRMEEQGLYAKGKKWENTKAYVLKKTKNAKEYNDTYQYLEQALVVAGRKHSYLETNDNKKNNTNNKVKYPSITKKSNILTIKMPSFSGNDIESKHYANIINQALQKEKYKGVIIDLRNNVGGDMGPMIAGLSSLLEDGKLLTYIDKDNNKTSVNLNGSETENGGTPVKLSKTSKVKQKFIAILINKNTASSGEITALSFKDKKNVKYFGSNSAGYTSANTSIDLYDGSIMNLTTHKLKDQTGKIYINNSIIPNVKINKPEKSALEWITSS